MGRNINKLTARQVAALNDRGYYGDGNGLWLQVSKYGSKNWVFRFALNGRAREMGLGPVNTVKLAEARQEALACRKQLREGIDPIEARIAARQAAAQANAKAATFKDCTASLIDSKQGEWKNAKHSQQWRTTLETYAYPILGDLPVADIDTGLVMKVLEPIWTSKTETASRLRGRIESVLAWATTRNYRTGENPACWRGHLENLLPKPSKVKKRGHHPALPFPETGQFIKSLHEEKGVAARALEFAILTSARTSEVLGANWDEIDLAGRVWTIPANRMKAVKEHRIPLSVRAVEILEEMQSLRSSDFVFPGMRFGKPLSNMALLQVLKRMGRDDLTVHGFRSTFRDWAGETTAYPREVIEHALAHQLKDKAEAAYARGTLFDKRRRLMSDWASYCSTVQAAGSITPIRKAPL